MHRLITLASAALAWAIIGSACGGGPPAQRLAFSFDRFGEMSIYASNPDGTGQTYLTSNLPWQGFPAWSPDGTRVAFYAPLPVDRSINRDVFVALADGSGVTNLTSNPAEDAFPIWSS